MGIVMAVCTSENKGEQKQAQDSAYLEVDRGVRDDAHAGPGHRQVSLLSVSSIDKMKEKGLTDLKPGAFGENLVVDGLDVVELPVGTRLKLGDGIVLEITQIGKECHERCAIYYQAGDCVMPREGVFARVISGGKVQSGDKVQVLPVNEN